MSKTRIVNLILDVMEKLISKDEIDDAFERTYALSSGDGEGSDSIFELWLRNIPLALRDAFEEINRAVHEVDDSGTTATVVLTCGRETAGRQSRTSFSRAFAEVIGNNSERGEAEIDPTDLRAATEAGWGMELFLVTANVGDSHAFFYSGANTTMLNIDHRLDSNNSECERVRRAGGRVDNQETATDKGPLRLYPGGLMMSRTLGDRSAPHAIATPEVRTYFIPPSGGRLIIASDGLWDIASGKQASRLVHGKAVQPASQLLVSTAQRKDSRDDITVTVVDILSSKREDIKLPWCVF